MAERRLKGDGAALGEAGQDDSSGGNAFLVFRSDQGFDQLLRRADSRFILGPAAEQEDVVPGPHAHALVDGDRPHRGVRKDEAHLQRFWQTELGDDRLEVAAVGAQAVQPDDGRARARAGRNLDGFHALSVTSERLALRYRASTSVTAETTMRLAIFCSTVLISIGFISRACAQPLPPTAPDKAGFSK